MKRVFTFLLALALAVSLAPAAAGDEPVAVLSNQSLAVNGRAVNCQAYNVDGYNYFRLRDLAMLLRGTACAFSVEYLEKTRQVRIIPGGDYAPDGSELPEQPQDLSAGGVPSSQSVLLNDSPLDGLSVWNFGGNNYFKLAELAGSLGFDLRYDAGTRTLRLDTPGPSVAMAESYADILSSLEAYGAARGGMWATDTGMAEAEDAAEMPVPMPAASAGGAAADNAAPSESAPEYSGTNVQVAGIDEGDIVKTDGSYIYVLNGDEDSCTLTIVKADGSSSRVVSKTKIVNGEESSKGDLRLESWKYPVEMFVSDGTAAIISNYYDYTRNDREEYWWYDDNEICCVDFYDVSNPAAPRLTASLGQDGSLLASRLLDGRLYLVSSYWVWGWDEDDPVTFVPCFYKNGAPEVMEAEHVAICGTESSSYVVTGCYDLGSGSITASRSLLGGGDTVYMNGANLYVLGSDWEEETVRRYTERMYLVTEYRSGPTVHIYRFDLSDGLELAADGSVPGYLDSQFSADEWNGNLRLVATRNESRYRVYEDTELGFRNTKWDDSSSGTGLYILDRNLTLLGSVTDLAPGEQVYSARFDGEIAYFSTFRTVDPLFAVDCSDPGSPKVLSALKISGFSEYLHPWTADRLFGFGREADEDTGRAGGLKLVMFDTKNKTDVTVLHTLELDESYSEALYNHRAFFISPEKNIIGFLAYDEYRIYSYDDARGFTELCRFDFDDYAARGLYIGDHAYIVGRQQLMSLDMRSWGTPFALSLS